MRLLNTKTGQFKSLQQLEAIESKKAWEDRKTVRYAILSHTWRSEEDGGEQSYEELKKVQASYGHDGLRLDRLPAVSVPPSPVAVTCPCACCAPNPTPENATAIGPIPPSSVDSVNAAHPWLWMVSAYNQAPMDDPLPTSSTASDASVAVGRPPPRPNTKFSIWHHPTLSPKIREACRVARENGYEWIWIDSSCIDKSSSSELSEAINSMYRWYAEAHVCYAFLADVPAEEDHWARWSSFRESKWFTRGWTLQELIAPPNVVFLAKDWTRIGSKHSLHDLIEEITGISYRALLGIESLDSFSVAQRLSWASRRKTTRMEDRAYSLLGIFDINMPTLYGEGDRAFQRLQEEIMRRIPDQSLFAWGDVYLDSEIVSEASITASLGQSQRFACIPSVEWGRSLSFLARSPSHFKGSGSIAVVASHTEVFRQLPLLKPPFTKYTSTPHGIRTQVPALPISQFLPTGAMECKNETQLSEWYLVILGCEHKDSRGHLLGRVCYIPPSESGIEFLRGGYVKVSPKPERSSEGPDLFPLSPATIERCRSQIQLRTVYISHPDRGKATLMDLRMRPHETIHLILARETHEALRKQGYTVDLQGPDEDHPTTRRLTLSNDERTIIVEFQRTVKRRLWWLTFTLHAHVRMSRRLLGFAADSHQADPCELASWSNPMLRKPSFGSRSVTLSSAGARTYTVNIGLDFVGSGYYFLRVEVLSDTTAASSPPPIEPPQGGERPVSDAEANGDEQDAEGEADEDGRAVEQTGLGEGASSPGVEDAEDAGARRPEDDDKDGDEDDECKAQDASAVALEEAVEAEQTRKDEDEEQQTGYASVRVERMQAGGQPGDDDDDDDGRT